MARGYKTSTKAKNARAKWRARGRKRYYNKKKKSYKISIAKLASKKIDSLLERRIVEISQQQRVVLVSRRYFGMDSGLPHNSLIWGDKVNPLVEPKSRNWDYTTFRPILTESTIFTLNAISASDVNQPLNIPEDFKDQDGVNQGMITQIQDDHRQGNIINITGISLNMRIIFDAGIGTFTDDAPPPATTQFNHFKNFKKQTNGYANIYYKVILVHALNQTTAEMLETATGSMANLPPNFGYTPRLDKYNIGVLLKKQKKYKTLCSGRVKLRCKVNFISSSLIAPVPFTTTPPQYQVEDMKKMENKYIKFDKPLTITYDPRDQSGTDPDDVILLVIKSDIDTSQAQNPLDLTYAPRVTICSKVYYTEP